MAVHAPGDRALDLGGAGAGFGGEVVAPRDLRERHAGLHVEAHEFAEATVEGEQAVVGVAQRETLAHRVERAVDRGLVLLHARAQPGNRD